MLSVAFHPGGRLPATGAGDYLVRLWDVGTRRLLHTLHGHKHRGEALCFSPDGRWLASASFDETIRIWDVETGECAGILHAPGPYAGMNISGVTGISPAQKAALRALGAVETEIRRLDLRLPHPHSLEPCPLG